MNKHNETHPKTRLTRRGAVAATAAATLGLSGVGYGLTASAVHNRQAAAAVDAEPACELPPQPGDGPSSIINRANHLDGNGGGRVVVYRSDGVRRTPQNTPRFYVDGSEGLQENDTVGVEHMDPNVCQSMGGVVVKHLPENLSGK